MIGTLWRIRPLMGRATLKPSNRILDDHDVVLVTRKDPGIDRVHVVTSLGEVGWIFAFWVDDEDMERMDDGPH